MKILSLNVNGLSSKLDNGLLDIHLAGADIICLTETKTDFPDLKDTVLANCKCYSMQKLSRNHKYGGIHGICIIFSDVIYNNSDLVADTRSESTLWLRINKEILGFEFVLGAIYLPCEGSVHFNDDIFDKLADDLIMISSDLNVPVCLIGDVNARTGKLDDLLDIEKEVSELTGLSHCDSVTASRASLAEAGFTTDRYNKDSSVNNNGKQLIVLCQALDLKIVNGRFGSDRGVGDFTCYNNKGGCSVIDYTIVSPVLFKNIRQFSVDQFDPCLSDVHCPIVIQLESSQSLPCTEAHAQDPDLEGQAVECISFKWSDIKATGFAGSLAVADTDALNLVFESLVVNTS